MSKLKPSQVILEKLASQDPYATPLSSLPGFLKKFSITLEGQQKLYTILSLVGDKEISHLQNKLRNTNIGGMFNFDTYKKIIHKEQGEESKLIGIAKQIIEEEFGSGVITLLKDIEVGLKPEDIDSDEFNNPHTEDLTKLSDEQIEFINKEQLARQLINAIIMGAGHRIFDVIKPESKWVSAINKVSDNLYQDYYDMVYTNLKLMRETTPTDASGENGRKNTGLMKLSGGVAVHIEVKADIFPVLLHEMSKGVVEYLAYSRYNGLDQSTVTSILSVDNTIQEHWMMILGPQIYKQLLFLIKESVVQYEEQNGLLDNKTAQDYIIPLLQQVLMLPAEKLFEFVEVALRGDIDGSLAINNVVEMIDRLHEKYFQFHTSNEKSKTDKSVDSVIHELISELGIDDKIVESLNAFIGPIKEIFSTSGYEISKKQIGKKLANYFGGKQENYKYSMIGEIYTVFIGQLNDSIALALSSEQENLALRKLKKIQAKGTFRKRYSPEKKKPKFLLGKVEEISNNITDEELKYIQNKLHNLFMNGEIQDWFYHHDEISGKNSKLKNDLISLDKTLPDCIYDRENGRELYNLTTKDQLTREASEMGGHCVANPGYIQQITNKELIVFSLRKDGKSKWTIGYNPNTYKITQVKGFTGGQKNSTLRKEESDYDHVIEAMMTICDMYQVTEIADIKVEYLEGKTIKLDSTIHRIDYYLPAGYTRYKNTEGNIGINKGSEAFIEAKYDSIHFSGIYNAPEMDPRFLKPGSQEYSQYTFLPDGSSTKRFAEELTVDVLDSKNNEKVYQVILMKKYDIAWQELLGIKIRKDERFIRDSQGGIGVVKSLSGDRFKIVVPCIFTGEGSTSQHDGKTIFLHVRGGGFKTIRRDGRKQLHASVTYPFSNILKESENLGTNEYLVSSSTPKNDGKLTCYGIVRKTKEGNFEEILPCKYTGIKGVINDGRLNIAIPKYKGEHIVALSNQHNHSVLYGIIKKGRDGKYSEVLPMKYIGIRIITVPNLFNMTYEVQTVSEKYGLVYRNEKGQYVEAIPCEYDGPIKFGTEKLDENEAMVRKDGLYGIIRGDPLSGFELALPCVYDSISSYDGLLPSELTIKRNRFGEGILARDNDNNFYEALPCRYSQIDNFNDRLLNTSNITIARLPGHHLALIRRNKDSTLTEVETYPYNWVSDWGGKGLLLNEGIVENGDDRKGIVRREGDKLIELINCKYSSIHGFGGDAGQRINENLSLVNIKVTDFTKQQRHYIYGMLQRGKEGNYKEIIPCDYEEIKAVENIPELPDLFYGSRNGFVEIFNINDNGGNDIHHHTGFDHFYGFGALGLLPTQTFASNIEGTYVLTLTKNEMIVSKIEIELPIDEIKEIGFDKKECAGRNFYLFHLANTGYVVYSYDGNKFTKELPQIYEDIDIRLGFNNSLKQCITQDKKEKKGILRIENGTVTEVLPPTYKNISYHLGDLGLPENYYYVEKFNQKRIKDYTRVSDSEMGIIALGQGGLYHEVVETIYKNIWKISDGKFHCRGKYRNDLIVSLINGHAIKLFEGKTFEGFGKNGYAATSSFVRDKNGKIGTITKGDFNKDGTYRISYAKIKGDDEERQPSFMLM